jgi:hypothetical protein
MLPANTDGVIRASLEGDEAKPLPDPLLITTDASTNEIQSSASVQENENVDFEYPSGLRLGLIIASTFVSMFLVSLVSNSAVHATA